MGFIKTPIDGLFLFEPKIFNDERGYFFESFRADSVIELGFSDPFIQDNQSFSSRATLRGLHFQKGVDAQSKLVRVLVGEVQDVVVDIRPESKSFGQSFSVNLSAENQLQLLIPRGFAHGYLVLSEHALFCYKCDNYYNKESEGGIRYDDETIGINWLLNSDEIKLSEKDKKLPFFKEMNIKEL